MNTKTITTFAILVAILGCGDPGASAPTGPPPVVPTFEPQGGQFRVDAPVEGWKRTQGSADMPDGGKLITVNYIATDPSSKIIYVLKYSQFPSESMVPTENREEALDNAAIGLIKPYRGSMTRNETIKLGEFSGRQIRFDVPGNPGGAEPRTGLARLYLANLRLYTMIVLIPVEVGVSPATPPEVDRFFNTFTLIQP